MSVNFTFEVELDSGRVESTLAAGSDEAAFAAGSHILQVAQSYVPHEDGVLERSGDVTEPEDGEVTVFFDTPYAVRQHEELDYQHDDGRTAKYLERPLNEEQGTISAIILGELQI